MKKTQILMNKPIYLNLSMLNQTEAVIYEFWYGYIKPKYDEKVKLCYIDTDNFIVYLKTDFVYKNIAEVVEIRFDNSSYELEKPLPKRKK